MSIRVIAEVFFQHFDDLFRANDEIDVAPVVDKVRATVPPNMAVMLTEAYVKEEVREALKQMHPTKAPGPDGMCALLYQKFWSIVRMDVENTVLEI